MITEGNKKCIMSFLSVSMAALKDRRVEWFKSQHKDMDQNMRELIIACIAVASVNGLHDFIKALVDNDDSTKNIKICVDGRNIIDPEFCEMILKNRDWDAQLSSLPGVDKILNKISMQT